MATNSKADNSDICVASLRRRLLAMVYDVILVFALVFCAAMLYAGAAMYLSPAENERIQNVKTDEVVHEVQPIDLGWGIWPYSAAIGFGFYIFFWKKSGQTLGMRAWKLKLHNRDDQPPSITQLFVRCLAALLSLLLLGFGYWFMFFNPRRDTLHDKLSRTWISMPAKN